MAMICAKYYGIDDNPPDLRELYDVKKISNKHLVFVTATDGNHGAAVAYAAKLLGQKAIVFMPEGASQARVKSILVHNAECRITDVNYDETVRLADFYAAQHNFVLIQDTAWPGYEEIPQLIMEGYTALAHEIVSQLQGKFPTHIFLQSGVGSFAASMVKSFSLEAERLKKPLPIFICMEPENAAPLYLSIGAGTEEAKIVEGKLQTVMDGLACGKISSVAWPILRDNVFAAISCPDSLAAIGMDILENPYGQDPKIFAGQSGAVGAGVIYSLLRQDKGACEKLHINKNSSILLISTEGRH